MLRSRRIGAMRDVELDRALLGLTAPWTVAGVDVDMRGQRVVVRVEAGPGPYPCPECGTPTGRYDSKPRRWRHLDTMQFTTWIEAAVPRVECGTHGVKQLRVPWAEPGSQFTALFERLAIDLLRECSITGARGQMRAQRSSNKMRPKFGETRIIVKHLEGAWHSSCEVYTVNSP